MIDGMDGRNHLKCMNSVIWLNNNASSIPRWMGILLEPPTNKQGFPLGKHAFGRRSFFSLTRQNSSNYTSFIQNCLL
uniref:Uncharacterized protein n=1 Tax=Picea glauca TaxID=3330 RepID=A0A117NHC8_PICGL|nr:hypothetical protein ABT39_MTgene5180 [Picea glauca]